MTDIGFAKHVKYNGVVKFEVIKVSNKEDGQPRKNQKVLLTIWINWRFCITYTI